MLADDDRYTSATLAEGARVSPAVIAAEWPRRRRSSRSWAAKWRKYGSAGPIAGGGPGLPQRSGPALDASVRSVADLGVLVIGSLGLLVEHGQQLVALDVEVGQQAVEP